MTTIRVPKAAVIAALLAIGGAGVAMAADAVIMTTGATTSAVVATDTPGPATTTTGATPATDPDSCRRIRHEGRDYSLCTVTAGADLRLFLGDAEGRVLGSFGAINARLGAAGQRLAFAMNAGMYHPDRRPVGLYIEAGHELAPLVTAAGPGNFGLLPNGVFCIRGDGGFAVIESRRFARERPDCRHATQSGPLLVIAGALHPRFLVDATSRHIRNGVGVSPDGRQAWFVISDSKVTFHEFASLFRDGLGARDALYFDGSISRLYAPQLGRNDLGWTMGPVIGLVRK